MSSPSNTSKPPIPKVAEPRYGQSFDSWNSSATGHQRAENHLGRSMGWRRSRNTKLTSQFKGGSAGGQRVSDTVGAGSKDWVPNMNALVTPELRSRAKCSITSAVPDPKPSKDGGRHKLTAEEMLMAQRKVEDETRQVERAQSRGIFDGVVVYVNGSTHPLGRRQVTHVIIGRSAGGTRGSGGGLAGGKLQREIQKVGGCAVKFVSVEWVLESIKAGKRLPETRFSNLKIASKGQQSVYGLYSKTGVSPELDGSRPTPRKEA